MATAAVPMVRNLEIMSVISSWIDYSRLSMVSLFAGVRNAPNAARAIICNVDSAIMAHGYSYRSAPDLSIRGDKPGKKILILAGGSAVLHGNPDHLVAPAIRTIPRPVFRCESVTVVLGWEHGLTGRVKRHSERCHMRLNQYVWRNDFGFEFRMSAHKSWVLMSPHIEPGPTIEAAFLD